MNDNHQAKPKEVYIGELDVVTLTHITRGRAGILTVLNDDQSTKKRYEGQFEDDVPYGLGKIYYPNGDVYYGMTENMNKQGAGRLYSKATNKVFEGEFNKDMKEGVGYYLLADGRVYCGQFKQDNEEGVGEYLSEQDIINNPNQFKFKKIDKIQINIQIDKIYKICRQLEAVGLELDVEYDPVEPGESRRSI